MGFCMAFSRTSVGILGGFGGIPVFFPGVWEIWRKKTILLECLPSKKMDYILNSQKYFYVTYVIPLALNCQKGQRLPAPEVYKNRSPNSRKFGVLSAPALVAQTLHHLRRATAVAVHRCRIFHLQ